MSQRFVCFPNGFLQDSYDKKQNKTKKITELR